MPKRKLGVIGGMGSRASSMFLRKVIDLSPAVVDQDFIEIVMHNNSAIPDRTRAILYGEPSPLPELLKSVRLMNDQAVDYLVMVCITSYYFAREIQSKANSILINPIDLVIDNLKLKHPGCSKVGLLATTGTIRTRLFHDRLEEQGLETIVLSDAEQEDLFMRALYMPNGLKSAVISQTSKDLLNESACVLQGHGADIIVGGCSEVQLGIDTTAQQLAYVDAVDLLAEKVVEYSYETENILIN